VGVDFKLAATYFSPIPYRNSDGKGDFAGAITAPLNSMASRISWFETVRRRRPASCCGSISTKQPVKLIFDLAVAFASELF
jgi:hypothetical protein